MKSKEYVPRLEVPMGDAIPMEERKGLQGLLEDAPGHLGRVADLHLLTARFELRELLDHGIHARAHGLEY